MTTADAMHELRKRPVAGRGRVIGYPGGSLWIGRLLGPVQEHAHHAIQISLSMEGGFGIRADGWPDFREATGMVVMPDRPHSLDGRNGAIATLFVEPNSSRGAALRQRFGGFDVAILPDAEVRAAVQYLQAQYEAAAPDELLAQYAQGAVCRIAGNPAMAPSDDPRITNALAWMRARLATTIRLEDVAAAVHLSPGRSAICSSRRPARRSAPGCCGHAWTTRWRLLSRAGPGPKQRTTPASPTRPTHAHLPPRVRPGADDVGAGGRWQEMTHRCSGYRIPRGI